jgi:hypothetical protein
MAGRGRPKTENPLVFKTIGLTVEQWDWLYLWFPTGNRTDRMKELFERAMKFWPGGPGKFR